jgi:chromosome segregation protein
MSTFITRITLQGFKSFNKKISVPMLNGFVVVCGPNGTGKSNIVDSICFVLGRTSAKSLRAERLHELIFHGGNGKAPATIAAVTLYLDNSNKLFPFEDPEISVTRKVNKKGVCVYKINGKTTTREKVLELLSSARIYPDGHNIILQGDVTSIIEMNAVERRSIIDEISGIAEYNDKKIKAGRDLEMVDQKLKEAEIVITERYDIFKRLENERNAAIKYQNLQKELVILKASLAHSKITESEKAIADADKKIERKEVENDALQKRIDEIENQLEHNERLIQDLAKNVKIEKEVAELRSNIMINEDRINSSRREIERLNSLIEKLEAIDSRRAEISGEMPHAVRAILQQKLRGVHNTVANVIKVADKHSIAIEVAAGPHLNDIIVDDPDVAKFCIEYLRRERIGRATFLPLNKIRPRTVDRSLLAKKGVIGVASDLMEYDKTFGSAVEFVFGGTLIVDSLDTAKTIGIGKERMVTLDGDLVEKTGAMIGGYYLRTHPKMITSSAAGEIEQYRKSKAELERNIEELTKEIKELNERLKAYASSEGVKEIIDLEKLRVESDKLKEERKQSYEKRIRLQNDLNRLKIGKARLEAELDTYRIDVKQYGDVRFIAKPAHELEQSIIQAQTELNSLGPVNFKAIEQYEGFRTEFDEYKQRYEKILEEKKAVLDMIEKIEERRREVFNHCLTEVAKHFNDIFQKMTNGSASLELENPIDLESGLIIQANPGGKMLLNIDSLSGGEKTLTAMAFLFAVQEYKPAPFYILDEIDAALDKENSKKMAELIKSLSKEAQFIVITHNDQTIKYGDRVFGVTMDKGESKILGLEMP